MSMATSRIVKTCARLVSVASVAALAVACASNTLPSTFGSASGGGGAEDICSTPNPSTPARVVPSGTSIRAIAIHVTNDSGGPRWVQTGGDEGCAIFDVLRGGSPLALVPPALCGCDCQSPQLHATYTRLAPGESVDLHWDGVQYQLTLVCVTGTANGCPNGETKETIAASGLASPPTNYTGVLHVESIEPPGCAPRDGSPIWACDAKGAVPSECAHGTGQARFPLALTNGAASSTIPVSLK
jgi:hypothetical protein